MVKRIAIVMVMVCVGLTLASGQEPFVASGEADMFTSLPRAKAVEAAKDLAVAGSVLLVRNGEEMVAFQL